MKRIGAVLVCIFILLSTVLNVAASDRVEAMAASLQLMVPAPSVGSIGGEWVIIGLARSEAALPDSYFDDYYARVEAYVAGCNGVLHKRKYTEYSRVILALTAIGKDPQNVSGYNLLIPLGDFKKTVFQGANGAAWALIALDSGSYIIPKNPEATVQATRELYIEHLLTKQNEDGGWGMSETVSEPDLTAMVLTALARYQEDKRVFAAIERGLFCLSSLQNSDGGFTNYGIDTCESSAQVLAALCTLGVAPTDARFVKNGNTVVDSLYRFYIGTNGFLHTLDDTSSNLMATEQAFYAMVAYQRFLSGDTGLYQITPLRSRNLFERTANEVLAICYNKGYLTDKMMKQLPHSYAQWMQLLEDYHEAAQK